jgi:hypothetical protein
VDGGKVFAACGNSVASDDLLQSIPLKGLGSSIDAGRVRVTFSALVATYAPDGDFATTTIEAFTASKPTRDLLGSVTTGDLTDTGTRFVTVSTTLVLPKGTRGLTVDLRGTKVSGNYCDAYFDNVSVTLTKTS